MACLEEFDLVRDNLKRCKKDSIVALHKFIFEQGGDRSNRRRLRAFKGFEFNEDDDRYLNKTAYLDQNLNTADLTSICLVLGLNYKVADLKLHIFRNLRKDFLLQVNETDDDDDSDNDDDEGDNDVAAGIENTKSTSDDDSTSKYDDVCSDIACARGRQTARHSNVPNVSGEVQNIIAKTRFALNFRDIEDSIRQFDGSGNIPVEMWVEELEETADFMGLDEFQKMVFAKKSLRGIAKLFVLSEKRLTTWQKLKSALLSEFEQKTNSAHLHKMLTERKMKKEETVYEYFYKMKDMADRGRIEDRALIQYVIDGIKDFPSNKTILYGANNLKEFKEKLQHYEICSGKQKLSNDTRASDKKYNHSFGKDDKNSGMKCYNCGAKGHKSTNCHSKNKGMKCFECNKFGHMAKDCQSRKHEQHTGNVHRLTVANDIMLKSVSISNQNFTALFDTGSTLNVLKHKIYERLNKPTLKPTNILLTGFGNKDNKIRPIGYFVKNATIEGEDYDLDFYVIPDDCMDVEVVIGKPICLQAEIIINPAGLHISKIRSDIMSINVAEEDLEVDIGETASSNAKQIVRDMIENYKPEKKKTTNVEMKIILTDETPISSRPRRLPFIERQVVEKQVEQWLKEGVIECSESEFSSPVVLVGKKDGSKRLCVDYRKVNNVIIKDRFPLPLIEDVLDQLQDAKIFSTIDLKNGFFHVSVNEQSRKYTAFVTHNGQYQFRKVPFGLTNSPAVFQRYVNTIFRDLAQKGIALPYIDDLIIPAETEDEAIQRLQQVIQLCRDYGLEINAKKCHFLRRRVEFLGHVIENQRISASPAKVEALLKYPVPKTLKQVESFLGLAGYFRKFIPDFAAIAKPLSDLKKKDVKFMMQEEQVMAVNNLKNAMANQPVLRIFHLEHDTQLHTDASADGYGAVLMQKSPDDSQYHPVYYMSQKTSDQERKYSSYELEILAVITALKKFRVYLLGIKFTIITDCNAFAKTMAKRDLSTRVARWLLLLQEYNYTIEHRSGSRMRHVDALSRYPVMQIYQENILTRILEAQTSDKDLRPIRDMLQHTDIYNDYFLKSKILYKLVDDCEMLVIPRAMQYEIIKKAHEKGHFSVKKTKELICKDYYIPRLDEQIQRCVTNCIECLLINKKRGKLEGHLHPLPKKDVPLHTYHIDFLGPLASTSKMYCHIFAVIDAFTKFCWLYPTRSTTAKEVIAKLQQQSVTFGNPEVIISDRGAAFTSEDFRQYCETEGIQHHKVTTGLPRANGQVERLNSLIISVLAKLSIEDPAKWYKYVDRVQQIINSTFHRSTNTTPFEILIGRKMRTADDIRIKELIEEEILLAYDQTRNDLRREAKQQIAKVQNENKRSYNLRRKPALSYNIGDVVAIKRTQFGGGLKLKSKFLGPYVVQTIKPNNTYDVVMRGNFEGPKHTTTCAEFMKPWPIDNQTDDLDAFGATA